MSKFFHQNPILMENTDVWTSADYALLALLFVLAVLLFYALKGARNSKVSKFRWEPCICETDKNPPTKMDQSGTFFLCAACGKRLN